MNEEEFTATSVLGDIAGARMTRRKVRLDVLAGPDEGKHVVSSAEEINIGSLPKNDLALSDPSVSRYHLRIVSGRDGFVLTDLDSTNGTRVAGMRLHEATVTRPIDLEIGDTTIRFRPLDDEVEVPLHSSDHVGAMLGRSPQIRAIFAQLAPVAKSQAGVLINGETGTGKEMLAEEIHKASPRASGPFVVVDCGALPENLVESELFGHSRGSFTGATSDRAGAFELADGGTLFLDEIGEMSSAAQPRLLRALESGQVKRVGSDRYRKVDVRIVAATNRDLRLAINEGIFRADLYYRLSVVGLRLPSLRERPEDIPLLAEHFFRQFSPTGQLGDDTLGQIRAYRWPGNVRELRNHMQRLAVMSHGGINPQELGITPDNDLTAPETTESAAHAVEDNLPYKEAKARWIDRFEVDYVTRMLERHEGNVAAAAREAGMDRTYLFRLIRKYGLRD